MAKYVPIRNSASGGYDVDKAKAYTMHLSGISQSYRKMLLNIELIPGDLEESLTLY